MDFDKLREQVSHSLASIQSYLLETVNPHLRRAGAVSNRFLPFTNPKTPLYQDIIHTLLFCTILYLAPTFLEDYTRKHVARQQQHAPPPQDEAPPVNTPAANGDGHIAAANPIVRPPNGDMRPPNPPVAIDDLRPDAEIDEPGPAPAAGARADTSARAVGKKKAASLARKDQRRAYHEFQRSQGEAQRARDRAVEAETSAAAAEERTRRLAAEAEVTRKAEGERRRVKEAEVKAREEEMGRRRAILDAMREGLRVGKRVDLKGMKIGGREVDVEEAKGLAKAEGLLGLKDEENGGKEMVLVSGKGHLVRVSEEDMKEAVDRLTEDVDAAQREEAISWAELGRYIEDVLQGKARTRRVAISRTEGVQRDRNPFEALLKEVSGRS